MRLIILIIILIYFSLFFLGINDFFFAVYSMTNVSTFLPFPVVAVALWSFLLLGLVGVFVTLKNVWTGINWAIICLPMSALPFIGLGVPLGALNALFICRSLVNVFVYVLFLKWFMGFTMNREGVLRLPILPMVALLPLIYFFNFAFVEPDLWFSLGLSCVVLFSCIFFFYLLVNVMRDEETLRKILEVMVLACIIQVLLSSLSFFYYLIIQHRASFRVEGMLRDFELFAEYLAIHIPLFIYFLRYPGTILPRNILKASLVLTIFVLLATATRGAVISLVIGLVYYLFSIRRSVNMLKIIWQIMLWLCIVGVTLGVLYAVLPQSAQIIERFSDTNLTTFDTRQFVWTKFSRYFLEKPLTGHGIVYSLGTYLFFPHSTYFYYLLTLGIPGCAIYVLLLGTVFFKGRQNERISRNDPHGFELAVVLNTLFLIFVIDSIKIEYMRYSNYQLFVWSLFALVIAFNEILVRKSRKA